MPRSGLIVRGKSPELIALACDVARSHRKGVTNPDSNLISAFGECTAI